MGKHLDEPILEKYLSIMGKHLDEPILEKYLSIMGKHLDEPILEKYLSIMGNQIDFEVYTTAGIHKHQVENEGYGLLTSDEGHRDIQSCATGSGIIKNGLM